MILQLPTTSSSSSSSSYYSHHLPQFHFSTLPHRRIPVKLPFSLGGDYWKLTDVDPELDQERVNSWLAKAQTLITQVVAPIIKPTQGQNFNIQHELEDIAVQEEVFTASELTVDH